MHLSIFCPPGGGGGGHTRGFRQKTIPDRREFDKLMESGFIIVQFIIYKAILNDLGELLLKLNIIVQFLFLNLGNLAVKSVHYCTE